MTYPTPPAPSPPDYFRASDHVGSLACFRVRAYDERYSGWKEVQPAIQCDVALIDPWSGLTYHGQWIGNYLIVDQLRAGVGQTFYARIAQKGQAYVLETELRPGDPALIGAWVQWLRAQTAPAAPPPPVAPPAPPVGNPFAQPTLAGLANPAAPAAPAAPPAAPQPAAPPPAAPAPADYGPPPF